MSRFTVFLGGCVLVPIAPCDTLLRIADAGTFRPLWSAKVVDEALKASARIHPEVDESRFLSRFRSMDYAFEDALVEGWEPIERAVELPDPDDRHVVAAALRGRADAIITENTKDFPERVLEPLGLEAIRLDDFLLDQLDLSPGAICRVVKDQAAAMRRPPVTVETLLAKLSRSGAPRFARAVSDVLVGQTNSD